MPIFVDGFDHYDDNTEFGRKWDFVQLTSIVTTGGRNNSGYLNMGGTSIGIVRKHFAATKSIVLQYGFRVTFGDANNFELCTLTSPLGGAHCSLTLLNDGSLRYLRGATQLAISPGGTVSGGVWHYVEIEMLLSTAAGLTGTCVVKLNGDTIFNLSGINNNDDLVEYPTQFGLGSGVGGAGSHASHYDDLVLVTGNTGGVTEAAPFNTLFGDWAVRTLWPNGVGSINQFTPLAGANWTNVDETYPDDDTTYVEAATVGFRDLYTMTDLPATVSAVLGVCATPTIKKSDAGTRQFRNLVHRAGTTTATGATLTCTSAYAAGLQTMFRFDPITGVAPTPAQVNAYEAGYEVVT